MILTLYSILTQENAIRTYKEKLAVFDREFLVKQKNDEDDPFLNSTDPAESPLFELLTSYLTDGHDVSQRGIMMNFPFL